MKTNSEIADLIFSNPDDMEAVVRAIHLPISEFKKWIANTPLANLSLYWTMGFIGIPLVGTSAFHRKIQENKEEILKHFNAKFHIATTKN